MSGTNWVSNKYLKMNFYFCIKQVENIIRIKVSQALPKSVSTNYILKLVFNFMITFYLSYVSHTCIHMCHIT